MDSHAVEMEEIHQPQQVGPNMMPSVGGVPNHSNNVNRRNRVRSSLHSLMIGKRPISEAAQLEMKSLSNKTPVSILQELLSRRGTTPKYELIQVEGAIHEPIFRYRVTVADVVDPIVSAMGTGKSKKEAKHAAARAVLDKLCRLNSESPDSPLPNSIPDSENLQELSGYGEEKIITNPIGALQEMCMSRHWPPPKYTIENEEGLPHERQFTIVCSVLKYREVGQGKSKKVAKRHAAHKMWQALHYMTTENPNIDEDENTCLNDGDVNLVQFLQEIASEQQFEVTYVDIEEKSISGKCQCLVQLSTLPVAVCYGCGVTSKDAQASAAQNALEYLKIMTKK
ncbi:RISC-loading complex subunit tarbp2-like isoform X4 [Apis laboriosa]|uniref:RISC-loading complex subunit tarbp2-like isoform X6 n=1 Tax=Apis dorsata TaxID=7462 RepID=UPI0003DF5774|nr:RISC-loading complex subunit tarbp2-like isoform X6 [Apis dorsata]XP_043794409.1 RISC-loading complex subunit tarbp2-like isoform X4 [Apis laboriosa]